MSATRSPSADPARPPAPSGQGLPAALRKLAPRTFQARLTVGFAGVVGLTLLLVTIFVLNRLDDYFLRQQQAELEARSILVAAYVDEIAAAAALGQPVVGFDNVVNRNVANVLRGTDAQHFLADLLAQADVEVILGLEATPGDTIDLVPAINGRFTAVPQEDPQPGAVQEAIRAAPFRQRAVQTPWPYAIEIRLSNPYTFRQTSVGSVTTLLAAVGIVAVGIAIVIAAGMALRFTTPLRRLTEASRALAEGDLSQRIPRAEVGAGSTELAELAAQFNTMAGRLEESVAIIRRDRDRSRDFLADVSHELRTPIAALLMFNELLTGRAGDDPRARTEFLENSRVQLERLDWLAQNLLELSKLDSGLVLLDLRPDDLRAAVESAVEQAGPAARRRGVALNVTLPAAPVRIRHDPQRVGQVVANLILNAIKFSDPGRTVTVTVATHGDGARIDVVDQGVGIDAAELPRIFDRFYRGSRANEARGSGSGLGLAIVRSIVDMHRGTISVESRLGEGSQFSVILPRDPRRDDDPLQPALGLATEPVEGDDEPPAAIGPAPTAADEPKMADSSPSAHAGLNPGSSG